MAINLEKGSSISLEKTAPGLNNLHVGLGWDVDEQHGMDIDCDVSVFMVNDNYKIPADEYFVFFNNLTSKDGAVVHMGDNLTGEGEGDDEVINVNLSRVDGSVSQLMFVVTIHKAAEQGIDFGMIENAFIRIENNDTGEELCRYSLNNEFVGCDSVQVGRVYRYDGEWHFEALGDGYQGGLGTLLELYN